MISLAVVLQNPWLHSTRTLLRYRELRCADLRSTKKSTVIQGIQSFPIIVHSRESSRASVCKCAEQKDFGSFESEKETRSNYTGVINILKGANSFLPHIVVASTVLALAFPPSFTWFTSRHYAPALGFLMFAVGINSNAKDFLEAINRPGAIVVGYVGQFVIKPLFGYFFGSVAVNVFNLPASIGAGIMLVSCVSGAQLSNYATFLTDPSLAPLSIVMTALSTASAVFITPILSLLLIGKRLPVDVRGMMFSIVQIVVTPIASGFLLNRFFPGVSSAIRPFLPPLSVFVTALCVGSPLAINIDAILSPFGISILLFIFGFHASSFATGYFLTGFLFNKEQDVKALQRTISFETGMQSSLLALALANRFFEDPLVGVPTAISIRHFLLQPSSSTKETLTGGCAYVLDGIFSCHVMVQEKRVDCYSIILFFSQGCSWVVGEEAWSCISCLASYPHIFKASSFT